METELMVAVYRTQLSGPSEPGNVKMIQTGCKAQPLSGFLCQPPTPPPPPIDFPKPLTPRKRPRRKCTTC